jgi:hypothetical protein
MGGIKFDGDDLKMQAREDRIPGDAHVFQPAYSVVRLAGET